MKASFKYFASGLRVAIGWGALVLISSTIFAQDPPNFEEMRARLQSRFDQLNSNCGSEIASSCAIREFALNPEFIQQNFSCERSLRSLSTMSDQCRRTLLEVEELPAPPEGFRPPSFAPPGSQVIR